MTEKQWKNIYYLIILLIIFVFGFYLGRTNIKEPETKTIIEYLPGETITDTCYVNKPYKVIVPADTINIIKECINNGIYKELWPTKVITEYIEIEKEDTNAIIKDWASKRFYSETIFDDDKNGSCIINTEIQYNRMNIIGYTYTPVIKNITETKYTTKLFSPYIGLSYLFNPWGNDKEHIIQFNGGFFIKEKYGVQLLYQRGFIYKTDYIGIGGVYKF